MAHGLVFRPAPSHFVNFLIVYILNSCNTNNVLCFINVEYNTKNLFVRLCQLNSCVARAQKFLTVFLILLLSVLDIAKISRYDKDNNIMLIHLHSQFLKRLLSIFDFNISTNTKINLFKISTTKKCVCVVHRLYNAGAQPQFQNLYPAVKFPVARTTPMIASMVEWDHSTEWSVADFSGKVTAQSHHCYHGHYKRPCINLKISLNLSSS